MTDKIGLAHILNSVRLFVSLRRQSSTRTFLIVTLSASCCSVSPLASPTTVQTLQEGNDGTVHSKRLVSGVPLGGIGCGTVDLMTDGTFSHATINNNWDKPTGDLKGCFAAIWTDAGGRKQTKALQLASPFGLPTVSGVDYRGLFPQAFLEFPDQTLPVNVSLRAFSPLIPHDVKSSSLPAAIFVFKITNLARAPVTAAIAMSWENILGVGGTTAGGAFSDRTGNTTSNLPAEDGFIGLQFGAPGVPAVLPQDRLRYNASADANYALMVHAAGPNWKVTRGGWNVLDAKPGWWNDFSSTGTVPETQSQGVEGRVHPAGVVSARFDLKDRESKYVAFAVAWFTPKHWTLSGAEYGHRYEDGFSNAGQVCRYVLENRLTLATLTDQWQNDFLRSSLPLWLSRKLINETASVFTNSILTQSSGANGSNPGRGLFAILECPGEGKGALGGIDLRIAGYPLIAQWFPELWVQELRIVKESQSPEGGIPVHYGNIDVAISSASGQNPVSQRLDNPDSACAFAYDVFRFFKRTGDQKFLDEFYPAAKHAIEFAAGLDQDGDGLPDGASVFDRHVPMRESAYIASVWVGVLVCGRRLAEAMNDRAFAGQCGIWLDKARASAEARLISRRFLPKSLLPLSEDFVTYQLAGQCMADVAGAGDQFPSKWTNQVADELETLSKAGGIIPPLQITSSRAAPSISVAWLPFAESFQAALLANHGHVDSGLELMHSIDGIVTATSGSHSGTPLSINLKTNVTANCARTSAGTASWTFYEALCGVSIDMAKGRLALTPHIPTKWKAFTAPVFMPSFKATLQFRPGLQQSWISFRLDRFIPSTASPSRLQAGAGLVLTQVVVAGAGESKQVSASVGRAAVPGKHIREASGYMAFIFDTPVRLTAGQRLEFTIR